MITRKDIIDRLNQLTLRYNLTWDDIKVDADRAIIEINNLLGADYPLLSHVMLQDNSTYTVRVEETNLTIIKDEYFHSVIIPFIAMEILARDEEFTTIFSKYQSEYLIGKTNMFSREFNFVPDLYKRTRPEGVFFPAGNRGKDNRINKPPYKGNNPYHKGGN